MVRFLALGIHTARSTRLGSLLARVCASGPKAHSAPVAKTRQTRRDAQDSDAPHATELTTQHCPTPLSCVSHSSLRLVVCRPAVSCHSWYHSIIHSIIHSLIHSFKRLTQARAARARTVRRETRHTRCTTVCFKTWLLRVPVSGTF